MNDLIARIDGGLGNQLFQYAAGYSLAKRMNVALKLDLSFFDIKESEEMTVRNFMLDKFNVPSIDVAPKKTVLEQISKIERLKLFLRKSKLVVSAWKALKNNPVSAGFISFLKTPPNAPAASNNPSNIFIQYSYLPVDDCFFSMTGITYTYGNFMSETYFIENADEIRSFFSLKNPLSAAAKETEDQIKNKIIPVSLHVRRGDYAKKSDVLVKHGSTSLDYYKKAVDLLQKIQGKDVHFFVFSDDPAYIQENFAFLTNKTIVVGDTDFPHEDIYLMSICQHHIIANSTFSWWGAWLNPNEDKTVIAPRWWFARETMKTHNTMDICPDGWILI